MKRALMDGVLKIILMMTFINIVIGVYMTYATLKTGILCRCASKSLYYYIVFLYFLLSTVFFVYSVLYTNHIAKGKLFYIILAIYTFATMWFIYGVNAYAIYVKSYECNCVEKKYEDLLHLLSKMRWMLMILSFFTVVIWLLSLGVIHVFK